MLTSGQKFTEGRHHQLPKPWPRWFGHVTTVGTCYKRTKKIRNNIRYPRAFKTCNDGDCMSSINSNHVRKLGLLAQAKEFFENKKLYKGCKRPEQGFPRTCVASLVLYDTEVDVPGSEFPHNWRWKSIIVFGEPIMGVRGFGGRGVESGSKPLKWWGIWEKTPFNETLVYEIKRRLPNIYHK